MEIKETYQQLGDDQEGGGVSRVNIVQSLNSSFLPPHIGAEPGRSKRRVQDNLHAHAQNEPIKNYYAPTFNTEDTSNKLLVRGKSQLLRKM